MQFGACAFLARNSAISVLISLVCALVGRVMKYQKPAYMTAATRNEHHQPQIPGRCLNITNSHLLVLLPTRGGSESIMSSESLFQRHLICGVGCGFWLGLSRRSCTSE